MRVAINTKSLHSQLIFSHKHLGKICTQIRGQVAAQATQQPAHYVALVSGVADLGQPIARMAKAALGNGHVRALQNPVERKMREQEM